MTTTMTMTMTMTETMTPATATRTMTGSTSSSYDDDEKEDGDDSSVTSCTSTTTTSLTGEPTCDDRSNYGTKSNNSYWTCTPSSLQREVLLDPCSPEMNERAPDRFQLQWPMGTYKYYHSSSSSSTSSSSSGTAAAGNGDGEENNKNNNQTSYYYYYYGTFTADCVRRRAPHWVDRVYNLARYGFYNDNYFFRVIPHRWVQFGTNGVDTDVGNRYNYQSTLMGLNDDDDDDGNDDRQQQEQRQQQCAIIQPQPPEMPRCMADPKYSSSDDDCDDDGGGGDSETTTIGLSNTRGTLVMSTSYNETYPGYDDGVTWNATAELFINLGNNQHQLDQNLFVPICTIDMVDMDNVVDRFPSFGECADLGGPGPKLSQLYQEGNEYIQSNRSWDTMAISSIVSVCIPTTTTSGDDEHDVLDEGGTTTANTTVGTPAATTPDEQRSTTGTLLTMFGILFSIGCCVVYLFWRRSHHRTRTNISNRTGTTSSGIMIQIPQSDEQSFCDNDDVPDDDDEGSSCGHTMD